MEFRKVTLTFESADESSMPVLTHGAICFLKFHKMKFGHLVAFAFS